MKSVTLITVALIALGCVSAAPHDHNRLYVRAAKLAVGDACEQSETDCPADNNGFLQCASGKVVNTPCPKSMKCGFVMSNPSLPKMATCVPDGSAKDATAGVDGNAGKDNGDIGKNAKADDGNAGKNGKDCKNGKGKVGKGKNGKGKVGKGKDGKGKNGKGKDAKAGKDAKDCKDAKAGKDAKSNDNAKTGDVGKSNDNAKTGDGGKSIDNAKTGGGGALVVSKRSNTDTPLTLNPATTIGALAIKCRKADAPKGTALADIRKKNGAEALCFKQNEGDVKETDACDDGDSACIQDKFCQCSNKAWGCQQLAAGTACVVLPLRNSEGTSVTVATKAEQDQRINDALKGV